MAVLVRSDSPHRNQQPPAPQPGKWPSHFHLQRLHSRWRSADVNLGCGKIYPPVSSSCSSERVYADTLLRFLANCHRAKKLGLCRELLGVTEVPVLEKKDWPELVLALTGKDPLECPKCHRGRLVQIQTLLPFSNLDPISTRSPP